MATGTVRPTDIGGGSGNGVERFADRFLEDLAHVVDNATSALGHAPALTIEGAADLVAPDARPELLAVLQEALSNVAGTPAPPPSP